MHNLSLETVVSSSSCSATVCSFGSSAGPRDATHAPILLLETFCSFGIRTALPSCLIPGTVPCKSVRALFRSPDMLFRTKSTFLLTSAAAGFTRPSHSPKASLCTLPASRRKAVLLSDAISILTRFSMAFVKRKGLPCIMAAMLLLSPGVGFPCFAVEAEPLGFVYRLFSCSLSLPSSFSILSVFFTTSFIEPAVGGGSAPG